MGRNFLLLIALLAMLVMLGSWDNRRQMQRVLDEGYPTTAQITGVLLVFALLLAPAAIARELTPRVGLGLGLSVLLGLVIAWVGLGLSYFTNDPPGFFVTTVGIVLFAGARLARRL